MVLNEIICKFNHAVEMTISDVKQDRDWLTIGYLYALVPFASLAIAVILAMFGLTFFGVTSYYDAVLLIIRYSYLLLGWYVFWILTFNFVRNLFRCE